MRNKKFFLSVLLILLYAAEAFGAYDVNLDDAKWEKFSENVLSFAGQIVANNKPAYEQKLTKKERYFNDEFSGTGTSPVMWQRVWSKHKTIVSAWATSNKKFHANIFETVNPEYVFINGIHVGGSIRDLENFFGTSIENVNETKKPGIIYGSSQSESGFMAMIIHDRGIIKEISVSTLDWTGGFPVPNSQKALRFISNERKKMGIPENIEVF